jgi:hypothetical protein
MPRPEEFARTKIDELLNFCGWKVQDRNLLNLAAGRSTHGEAETVGVEIRG